MSLRYFSLKCLTMQASPHYHTAIFSHHGPQKSPEQEPRSSTGPDDWHHDAHCLAFTHRNNKGKDSLHLTLQGCAHVHETLIQDKTVVDTEEHLALFRLSLCSQALLEKGIPSWERCVLPGTKPLVACGLGSIHLLGFFPIYYVHKCKLCCMHPRLLAQTLMLPQELLAHSDLTPVSHPYSHSL